MLVNASVFSSRTSLLMDSSTDVFNVADAVMSTAALPDKIAVYNSSIVRPAIVWR